MRKNPRIGSKVFVIWRGNLFIDHVYAKGRDFFITKNSRCDDYVEDYRSLELKFEDYRSTWFSTLKEAKDKYNIKKIGREEYYLSLRGKNIMKI